jgi:ubiquinone/menaquinone biosynthesis C-methylase UbiE
MPATDARALDPARVQAFARKALDILVGGRLSLMLSVGHQTGLFDALAGLPPSTSAEVAAAAGLHERYVREWLGAMVTGGIVDYDPDRATYALPPEHAPALTRAGGPRNLCVAARATSLLATVEEAVVRCFRAGGGVPYAAYDGFTRLIAEHSARVFDAALIQRALPAAPGLVARLEAGIDVADVGCGSGRAVTLMARAFPASRFVGYDVAEDAIVAARAEADGWGLANARFELADAAALALTEAVDVVTAFDAIHDQADPAGVLAAIARALRPGGTFLMVEVAGASALHENLGDPLAPSKYALIAVAEKIAHRVDYRA